MSEPENNNTSVTARRSLPAWLIVLVALLGFRGCINMDEHGAAFSRTVFGPWKSDEQFAKLIPPTDPVFDAGAQLYGSPGNLCAACHQASGLGTPGQIPPIAGSEWVLDEKPDRLIRIVLNSVQGEIGVRGVRYNNSSMPAWRDVLDDKKIAAILTFIRQNKEWGHTASPVKPDQVAKIRKETETRATQWTEAELLQVPAKD